MVVLSGGCLLFGDEMPLKRFLGVCLALSGIFYFSALKMQVRPTLPHSLLPIKHVLDLACH